ncbi:MAG: TonB family protein [Candidatus Limnocylindria bacterium]
MSLASLRFPIAALLSAMITAGLFASLRALTNARSEADTSLAITKFEFVRLRREVEIEEKKREKPEREKPEPAPVTPTLAVAQKEGLDLGLDVQAIAAGLGADFGSAAGTGGDGSGELALSAGMSDRASLPLVRVEPQYPQQASRRGLEGWVVVQFTISSGGSTKNVSVVQSSDSIFERNAVAAVSKWKYQPQMRDGKPSDTPGVQVKLTFKMGSG